jgi:hypothetical protein
MYETLSNHDLVVKFNELSDGLRKETVTVFSTSRHDDLAAVRAEMGRRGIW